LRRWLVESDAALDPQAWVLTPDNVIAIARAIVAAPNHYQAGVAAARCAVELLRAGHQAGRLKIAAREIGFLATMAAQLDGLPEAEDEFIAQQMAVADPSRYLPAEYGL
jgi:methanol--5-hydroxybenzimidazolylcobamide Co-methyltransferase